ncbi:MAG TPA: chlorite dismutase family protein [Candidatus Brachybacterium merdigallinarum]|nr:chlorite dismutase family protein [Candidatus Brachybacterium merdigallinarum]
MSTTQHPGPAAADPEGSGASATEVAQLTRYTSYTVFRRLAGLTEDGDVTEAQIVAALEEVTPLMAAHGAEVLGFYDVSGFRAEDDLMLWMAAEQAEALQAALREFENSLAGTWLNREWASVGVHRQAEFSRAHVPSFMVESMQRKQWIAVYPFVRSYEWYLLPDEERREMLIEHGKLGRDFPQVNANTVAAFALGDYEWLLSFEADDLHDLVDMMRHLRYSNARLHVRDELPFHTGRRLETTADIAALLA